MARFIIAQRKLALLMLVALLLSACDLGGSNPSPSPVGGASGPSSLGGSSAVQTLPTLNVESGPQTAGPAGALEVRQVTQYINTVGGFTVIGLVRNQGSAPISDIKVTATVKDKNGGEIGSGADQYLALVTTLPPQASAPFAITFSTLSGEPATADVQAAGTPYVVARTLVRVARSMLPPLMMHATFLPAS